MKLSLSFSALNKYEICPRQYAFHYKDGLRTSVEPANLLFGGALHEALTTFIAEHAKGNVIDAAVLFQDKWNEAIKGNVVDYSSTQSPESLHDTGTELARQFPSFWDNSGLTALIGPDGEPLVERKLTMRVVPGVNYRGYLDVIAMTADGEIVIIDLKTALTPAPESTLLIGEQLTDYQALVESNKDRLGIESVSQLGFIELLKRKVPKSDRGKGPEIVGPSLTPARTPDELKERKAKIGYLADQIAKGAFFKKPGIAFNTPCSMCDFKDLCLHGSMDGLVDPKANQRRIA